jgi:hypothetical protein
MSFCFAESQVVDCIAGKSSKANKLKAGSAIDHDKI